MEDQENKTEKPQQGTWDNLKGYPKKISFVLDTPVVVTFGEDFENPIEMPSTDNSGVYYIFECTAEGENASITTSAWTLLNSLKSHMPLSSKTLIITKKNIKGKNMYYINKPDEFCSPKVEPEKEIESDTMGM